MEREEILQTALKVLSAKDLFMKRRAGWQEAEDLGSRTLKLKFKHRADIMLMCAERMEDRYKCLIKKLWKK